jgi:hypothetical protein
MNGSSGVAMDLAQSLECAKNLANIVYTLSECCLMAHTLRAMESHICENYNKIVFPIILTVEPKVFLRFKAKSYVVVHA